MRKIDNLPNPFESTYREFLDEPPAVQVQVFEDDTKSILSENKSPDLSFRWSINPYRGCFHACAYCYARPSHEYLGFGAGSDFESKIVVKPKAPELLRQAFEKPSWKGEFIVFSGDTDCYQPLEAIYGLTRKCLEVCLEYRNPATLITKSYLIARDAELLAELNRQAYAHVTASIAFADDEMARKVEPQAPSPSRRFQMIETLTRAGVPVGVLIAPVMPGLNEDQILKILKRARQAGATSAGMVILRLPGSVKEVYLSRMKKEFPDRIKKIENFIRDARGGKLTDSNFHQRHQGSGRYWETIERLFELNRKKLEFAIAHRPIPQTFRRPTELPLCRSN
ncbi:MAG: PA0069 family radical SAM protein [Elusimicrobia bacterium]|nr:PA0069 family radical SAM protein [Elusimicrobiota bacterium]